MRERLFDVDTYGHQIQNRLVYNLYNWLCACNVYSIYHIINMVMDSEIQNWFGSLVVILGTKNP